MDLFAKCKELYEKIRYFEYGIPVDGAIKPVPSAEYYVKNYHFLKPEEFEKYGGGICWDYVEYERKFLEVNDIDFNQYYIITNTPPNYDTHTFVTVKDGDDLIYIESSFKRVEHIIDGVQKFKTLEDIVKLITTNMWECNGNDKRFDEFKYDVCKFKGHPQYGCTCEEYMKWMDDNSDIVIQDVSINPKKVSQEELPVEEFTVNKIDTKFTQFVCESATNDPEEYDETLHDHIADEDDVYNESSVLKFPKKVNNVPFDIMYFGSNIDFGNESIKLDHNELFLTPYIGLASIFITDRKEYFKPLPKDRPHNTNIGYDEWGLSPAELQKPLKEVHVSLDDIPNVTPFEFDYTGYIYAIDVSQYKNNLYQKDWMTSDREFILKDINPVPIKEKIKWTHHVYVRGGKNTDGVFNESWTDFKNGVHPSSGLMFHVSLKNDMDGKTITPQLPSYITDGGKLDDNYQEDTKTKRLCVSPSIEGCMIAILNYKKIREHVGDKFYVYTPEKPFSEYKHKTNKEIVKDKLVFDANITKEAWILEPCKLKLYGIIKLKKVKDLKKKPTVEKNIKMNTIKLDYEWIMTPKASKKFNKAIGDSPDEESDKKEKPIKESCLIMDNEEFFMESQATRNKVLERLKYDPATQTIDTGVKDAQTGNNIRIKLKISSTKIDPELNKNGGAQFTKIVYDRPSSLYEMLSDSRCCIKVESNLLNQRNNSALAIIYHEIGHLVDWIATKYGNHLSNEDKQTCYRILNFLNKKADYFDRSDTNAHLNRRETFADKFANTKISSQALNKSNEKTDRKIMNDAYSEYKKFKKNKEYTKARENSLRHDKHELGSQLRSQLISSEMESSNILVSNEEFFMEANKNYEKALKILDYDPKTNTIKGNIPLPDGSTKERVLFVINSPLVNGACVASLDFYKNDLENKIRESEPGSKERNELEKHRELINNASRGKKDYEEFIVCMPRKNLKERNIGGVVSAMHEVGHVNYWCNTSKNNQQKARDFINKNKIDELTYNGPNHEHAIDSDEYLADDFAAKRTSKHASKKHISKLSLNELQKIYGEVKHRRKQLDVLKSKINPSKFEKDENAYLDALEKTYILMDEVEQLEDQLSKAYDLPKTPENETILNRVKKEYINLKNKQARTNESKDSKLNVVVMNERLNENIESFEKSIDEILYNIQSIKTEYNKRKEFVDKDLIKNVQESCLMDNEEFFGLE